MSSEHPEPGVPAGTDHDQPTASSPKDSQPQSSPPPSTLVDEQNTSQIQSDTTQDDSRVTDTKNTSATTGGETTMPAPSAPSDSKDATNDSQIEHGDHDIGAPAAEKVVSGESETKEMEDLGPTLTITLLLISGARHPFKIDGKYLKKRGVNVDNHDPFSMSVYTLKELIWREWRSDWETRPASPSSIRLISFGKLLEDKSPLSDSKFSCDAPNVVHMTVKPQEMIDEEDAKGAKAQCSRERDPNERSPGCRCIIL